MFFLLFACTKEEPKKQNPDPQDSIAESAPQDTGPDPAQDCTALGLPGLAFTDAEESTELYAAAADFTLETTTGSWNFKENWSGCDTYLFIPENPSQESSDAMFWELPFDNQHMLEKLPLNTHVFFLPNRSTDILVEQQERINDGLSRISSSDPDRAAWLADRIHMVDMTQNELPGWIGDITRDPGFGHGIDRFQRIRYIGAFADPERFNGSWFDPNIEKAANEAIYYNFEAEREAALDPTATVVPVFSGEEISDTGWAGARGYADVTLPADMSQFDTLEFDLYLGCVGAGEYGTCPAWDYLVYLYLCDADNPDNCSTEVGRWITTYHREGRWVHDVTPILPLLKEGGTRRFAFYTTQPYNVDLKLRLSNQSQEDKPDDLIFVSFGGYLSPSFNDDHPEVSVDIPADARRVELVTVMSGHGQTDPGTCAEFCNITNVFTVNGTPNVIEHPEAGTGFQCEDDAAYGTVPNQFGTWWYGRNGWCPGKEVPMVRTDITSQVTPGQTAVVKYDVFYNGGDYPGGDARMETNSYLAIYK